MAFGFDSVDVRLTGGGGGGLPKRGIANVEELKEEFLFCEYNSEQGLLHLSGFVGVMEPSEQATFDSSFIISEEFA